MDIPTPRFAIGATVYTAGIETEQRAFPCPDCLGTRKWEITTPAGTKAEMGCMRCGEWISTGLPDLKYVVAAPKVHTHQISGVTVKLGQPVEYATAAHYVLREAQPPGSSWSELIIHETHEAALAEAEAKATIKNLEIQTSPGVMEKKHFSLSTLPDARFDQFKNDVWSAFYRYRHLREQLDGLLKDKLSLKDLNEALREAIDWEDHPVHSSATPIERLVKAAEAILTATDLFDVTPLRDAYNAIPVFTRRVLLGEQPSEEEFNNDRQA